MLGILAQDDTGEREKVSPIERALYYYDPEQAEKDWRQALFDLLVKTRDICEQAEIPMVLFGDCALAAFRDGATCDYPEIVIDVRDAKRFAQAVEGTDDPRVALAGMTNDAHYPNFTYRVIDPLTIDFGLGKSYRFRDNCLHVRVRFLLHEPQGKADSIRAAAIRKFLSKRNNQFYSTGKTSAAVTHGLLSLVGRAREKSPLDTSQAAFDALVKLYSQKSDKSSVNSRAVPNGLLKSICECTVNGEAFPVSAKAKKLFSMLYDKEWKGHAVPVFEETVHGFRDAQHSWEDFRPYVSNVDFSGYRLLAAETQAVDRALKALVEPLPDYFKLLKRTHYRFTMRAAYAGRANELRELLDAGDTDQLGRKLKKYLRRLEKCRSRGLGLCFDPEIFDITMDFLRATDRADYARELEALVPDEHRQEPAPLPPEGDGRITAETSQQDLLFDITKRVVEFMEERGIRYYLLGGTCVGALRHGGFIPWDDDVDLMMENGEFQRFVEAFEEFPWDDIELNCFETLDNWRRPFAQLSYKRNAVFLRGTFFNRGRACGTRIDIMVLDDVRGDDEEAYVKDLLLYQESNMDVNFYRRDVARYADEFVDLKKEQATSGRRQVVERLKANVESHAQKEGCNKKAVRFWWRRFRDYDAKWFEGDRFCDFEGFPMRVPARAEACLRLQYGYDWYRIPSDYDQAVHNYIYNWKYPGSWYQDDIELFADFDEAERVTSEQKKMRVVRAAAQHDKSLLGAKMSFRRALMCVPLDDGGATIHELREQGKHGEIVALMKPLLCERKKLALVPVDFKHLPESVVDDWVWALIAQGTYYNALKLLDALDAEPIPYNQHEAIELALAPHGVEVEKPHYDVAGAPREGHVEPAPAISAIANAQDRQVTTLARKRLEPVLALAEAYQDNDLDALETALAAFDDEEQRRIPDAILARVKLALVDQHDEAILEKLRRDCEAYLEGAPANHDVRKALGDVLWALGEKGAAMRLFKDVHAKTMNGLDIHELEVRFGFEPRFPPRFHGTVRQ